MRIFALSDIHTDYQDNLSWLYDLSSTDYIEDTLILAGDISHDQNLFSESLSCLRAKFAKVFFVTGNHDLWLCKTACEDSMTKFWQIQQLCKSLDVQTNPGKVDGVKDRTGVWILPLDSWYEKPEESAESLFVPKQGEDPTLKMWKDENAIKWPSFGRGVTAAEHFLCMNEQHLTREYDAPVISFSHFLPRRELMFMTQDEIESIKPAVTDPQPKFNFSRVAGCMRLDKQIRHLGSLIHVYGHQHRNRQRLIDGVLYISYCLGYPHERADGKISGLMKGPKLIWDTCNLQNNF